MKEKIEKVCNGYHATLCPADNTENRDDMMKDLSVRLKDFELIINKTKDRLESVLTTVSREIKYWDIMVKKIKSIYHTLNYFNTDISRKCLVGECWVPTSDIPLLQKVLADSYTSSKTSSPSFLNVIETADVPPTYYRTNKFTKGFQAMINAYGIGNYQEVNPALTSIITFP